MRVSHQADEVLNFLKSREQFWDQLEVGGSKVSPAISNIPGCRSGSNTRAIKAGKKKKKKITKSVPSVSDELKKEDSKVPPNKSKIPVAMSKSPSKEAKCEKKKKAKAKSKSKKTDVRPYVTVRKPKVVIRKKNFEIKPTKAAFRWRTICESYRTLL